MSQATKITIFDTSLRDGELGLTHKLTVGQKLQIALLLDKAGVDVIEVGYPGAFPKDLEEIARVSKQVNDAVICGLASSHPDEIKAVATALKPSAHGRINIFTPVRIDREKALSETIETIQRSISLARNYCDDVEWSAFDATRSHPDVVCKAIETAVRAGATTIAIPDSMGVATPSEFVTLLETVMNQVPNIEQATIAVHCHNDQGHAVESSLNALAVGTRQIECSINGLGARAGNADLEEIVKAIAQYPPFYTSIELSLLPILSQQVAEITARG